MILIGCLKSEGYVDKFASFRDPELIEISNRRSDRAHSGYDCCIGTLKKVACQAQADTFLSQQAKVNKQENTNYEEIGVKPRFAPVIKYVLFRVILNAVLYFKRYTRCCGGGVDGVSFEGKGSWWGAGTRSEGVLFSSTGRICQLVACSSCSKCLSAYAILRQRIGLSNVS